MDSLGSLNAFVQAAEARSFTVAGRPLTHPLVRSRLTAGGRRIRTIGPPCDGRAIQDDGTSGDRGFRGGRHGGCVAAAPRWLARTVIPNSEMRHTMASYLGCGRL